jgi:hypothetical protein
VECGGEGFWEGYWTCDPCLGCVTVVVLILRFVERTLFERRFISFLIFFL